MSHQPKTTQKQKRRLLEIYKIEVMWYLHQCLQLCCCAGRKGAVYAAAINTCVSVEGRCGEAAAALHCARWAAFAPAHCLSVRGICKRY